MNDFCRRGIILSTSAILENFERLSRQFDYGVRILIPATRTGQYEAVLIKLLGAQQLVPSDSVLQADEPYIKLSELLGFEKSGKLSLMPALHLSSSISDIRKVKKGESVSYGGTHVVSKDGRIGLVPIGFADGIDRKLSGHLIVTALSKTMFGTSLTHEVPVVGRIAMDSISIDLEGNHCAKIGDRIELFRADSKFTIYSAANVLGITPSEFALRLSERAEVFLCR